MSAVAFYSLSVSAIATGLGAILASSTYQSILLFAATCFFSAGLFLLLDAGLLALVSISLMAGGVSSALWLFVRRSSPKLAALKSISFEYRMAALALGSLCFLQVSVFMASSRAIEIVSDADSIEFTDGLWFFVLLGLIGVVVATSVMMIFSRRQSALNQSTRAQKYRDRARNIAFVDRKAR